MPDTGHFVDHYEALGISQFASAQEIKAAYHKLSLRYHPDKNGGTQDAHARFVLIRDAYEVLKDENTRADYDDQYRVRKSKFERVDEHNDFWATMARKHPNTPNFGSSHKKAKKSKKSKNEPEPIPSPLTDRVDGMRYLEAKDGLDKITTSITVMRSTIDDIAKRLKIDSLDPESQTGYNIWRSQNNTIELGKRVRDLRGFMATHSLETWKARNDMEMVQKIRETSRIVGNLIIHLRPLQDLAAKIEICSSPLPPNILLELDIDIAKWAEEMSEVINS
ncbi:putative chaperone protein [Phaeoacremonium minimum UCRPA7]|uniref:Putative chaperone protein n=1 Tax=Phaeoacremonium minimum (strain UCR-PA7) TaxID=1286976 RepID=R8BMA4_PHAM7|nr:putative chaperone protein [Phaeoacremonium minimum UCRPA7]EOO00513.1 putative chaperone protein [Phaeoacremonium minimum UCRPA7]